MTVTFQTRNLVRRKMLRCRHSGLQKHLLTPEASSPLLLSSVGRSTMLEISKPRSIIGVTISTVSLTMVMDGGRGGLQRALDWSLTT